VKIIRLEASNVKRLKAVEIKPDGTLQVVTGRNAQGKSSVLDAIWLALGGGTAARETPRPVRDGEGEAHVTLDLGDLVVTRTWDTEKENTTLTVTAPDGAKYNSPQTLLDQLVGKLSFDPLAFTRLSGRDQRQALLDLLGLDFTAEDRERARLYEVRLDTGRQAHAFGDLPKLEKDAILTETPATAILDRISKAQDEWNRIRSLEDNQRANIAAAEDLERQAKELQAKAKGLREGAGQMQDLLNNTPAPDDVAELRAELATIEERNKVARDNQRVAAGRQQQKALEDKYTALGQQIATIDDCKAKALAAAEMPVDGLGFDEQGVTFRGVPFQQASSAEQIRVSLAMAMALNPSLRVIRIMDGSLLDAESMKAIAAMAKDSDYQVWIERVSDDAKGAVVIEDGSVVAR